MKRIVITGIGCITPIGNNYQDFTRNLLQGFDGIGPITLFDAEKFKVRIVAEVKNYDEAIAFPRDELNLLDRYSQFALLSAREAVADAQLTIHEDEAERTAAIYGTGIGGQITLDQGFRRLYLEGNHRFHPFTVPKTIPSAAASHISIEMGIKGPVFSTTSACSSSGHAICNAMMLMRSGLADVVLTGGSEAALTPGCFRAWEALRVMARDTCRPFSAKRGGMVLGEGGGSIVLETLEHAQARGAKIYAELIGMGMSSDAHSVIQPDVEGAKRGIRAALKDAGIQAEDIDYINAHGTGTAQNDPTETQAIREVFGQHADKLAVSSTKSMHGHALGAASIIEMIATLAAIQHQTAPATTNYIGPDPKCDLNYVPNQAQAMNIDIALSNSFAFGGLNTSLIVRKFSQ